MDHRHFIHKLKLAQISHLLFNVNYHCLHVTGYHTAITKYCISLIKHPPAVLREGTTQYQDLYLQLLLRWGKGRAPNQGNTVLYIISNTLQGNFRFYHRFGNAKKSGWRNQQCIPGCYFLPSLSVHNASDCNITKVRHVLNPEVLQLGKDYCSVNSQWHDLAWSLMWLPVEHKLNCLHVATYM